MDSAALSKQSGQQPMFLCFGFNPWSGVFSKKERFSGETALMVGKGDDGICAVPGY